MDFVSSCFIPFLAFKALEYYFEWIVLSDFGHLYSLHWSTALGAGVILFAHWIYLLAAGLDLWEGEGVQEDNLHQRGLKVMTNTKPSSQFNSFCYNVYDEQQNGHSIGSNKIVSSMASSLGPRFRHRPSSVKLANIFFQENYNNSGLKDLQPTEEEMSENTGSSPNVVEKTVEYHSGVREFDLPL